MLLVTDFSIVRKVVAVVGGGDTACEEAVLSCRSCIQGIFDLRKPFLRASKIMQERVMNHEKIEVLFEHNAVGLFGDNGVEGVNLVNVGVNRMKNVIAYLSTVSSWLSGINQILKYLKSISIRTSRLYIQTVIVPYEVPGVLQQEMWPIRIIVKLLQPREVDVRLPWRQTLPFFQGTCVINISSV